MSAGFPRYKPIRRRSHRRNKADWTRLRDLFLQIHPGILTIAVAITLSCTMIDALENRLRPVLITAARTQIKNAVITVAEEAIRSELDKESFAYTDLVTVERAEDGMITAITTDMAEMNRLRGALVEAMLTYVAEIDEESISIPVGSLIDSELVWGRGPSIKVKSFTVGTVSAEFQSEFTSAGVNQTLHKIWIELLVPTTILLPGTQLEVSVETRMCVAETVIVGKVPSYIQKAYG